MRLRDELRELISWYRRRLEVFIKEKFLITSKKIERDELTGLLKRESLKQWLDINAGSVGKTRRLRNFVIAMADLDDFKRCNDDHGHAVGDQLLIAVANRLSRLIPPNAQLFRLSGDEFVIIMPNVDDSYIKLSQIALSMTEQPYEIADLVFKQGLSIGYHKVYQPPEDANELLHFADLAMYKSKNGKTYRKLKVTRFRRDLLDEVNERKRHLTELRRHAVRGDLIVGYMPIVSLSSSEPVGFEVLLRPAGSWGHDFDTEQIVKVLWEIDRLQELLDHQIEAACRNAAHWSWQTGGHLSLSVNVIASQMEANQMGETIRPLVQKYRIAPDQLILEITEGGEIIDPIEFGIQFDLVKELGCRLAMDDFGAGLSDYRRLSGYPFDGVKLDKELTKFASKRHIVIAAGHVQTVHALGATVTAEWIDNQRKATIAKRIGCDFGQGSLYTGGRTHLSADEVLDFLSQREPQSSD